MTHLPEPADESLLMPPLRRPGPANFGEEHQPSSRLLSVHVLDAKVASALTDIFHISRKKIMHGKKVQTSMVVLFLALVHFR